MLILTKMMKAPFLLSSLIKLIKVLQEVEQEEMNVDESVEKEISDIKSNAETENITQDVHIEKALSAQEFEVLDLSNFNPNSVDLVFLSLRGYPQIIESCNSLSDLYGALKICDEYGISSPLKDTSARFKSCENISMENLISIMEIVEEIEKMKNFKDISDTLLERCVAYARWNFASWQVILKLIAAHKDNIHLIQRILKQLRDEPQAILRYHFLNLFLSPPHLTCQCYHAQNVSIPNKLSIYLRLHPIL